ncbi:hypothetical protein NQ318_005930 [Aromia moschata]|uniref:Sulfhydryl oxidase n=1 Tax=Aromia moschata TaxID=1265417 RepID=A0AAV8XJC7_9CUCU|nr:hypothetical protein NQ318_005930 [Aromia moschata]
MPHINTRSFIFFALLLSSFVDFSNNAALSIYEQKKYKRNAVGQAQGLYSIQDDVEILTVDNFKLELYGSDRAWLIEFYNSWCGFCQRFAPSWKALATDVKGWRDVVGIGVLDCANEDNYSLCRDFEIMQYPTLRYFHENYKEGPKNIGIKVHAGSDVKEHRQKLLEVIVNEQYEGRGSVYPNLLPYNHTDITKLYDSVPDKTKYVFLIIQNPTEYLGQEVAMDLHKIKDFIVRDNTLQSLESNDATREAYKIAIHNYLLPKHIDIPVGNNNKTIFTDKWVNAPLTDTVAFMQDRERLELMAKVKKMGDVVFQMDLETALRYSLRREIARTKEITGEKLAALRAYLSVLLKYFPFGKFGQMFLAELHDYVSTRETVQGADIYNMVKAAEREDRQVFSSPQQWLGCRGSKVTLRGYPCGLWKMFHYLAVNAAEYSIGPKGPNPKIVLEAMHGYIKNFFGCTDCSNHFQEMAKRREMDKVSTWNDSVLWLWAAHNEVNNRLSGDETEDPEYPKVQFPVKERCPQCYNADDSWNKPEVLRYLKQVYSSINVRYIGADTRILHLGLDGSVPVNSSGVFKTIDASMCFILYVASFLLIIILIRMFLKRGYRKKTYAHDLLGKV